MPNHKIEDKDAVCPFYKATMPHHITCEGVIPKSNDGSSFFNDADRKKHLHDKCNSIEGHKLCPRAKTLYLIWECRDE